MKEVEKKYELSALKISLYYAFLNFVILIFLDAVTFKHKTISFENIKINQNCKNTTNKQVQICKRDLAGVENICESNDNRQHNILRKYVSQKVSNSTREVHSDSIKSVYFNHNKGPARQIELEKRWSHTKKEIPQEVY